MFQKMSEKIDPGRLNYKETRINKDKRWFLKIDRRLKMSRENLIKIVKIFEKKWQLLNLSKKEWTYRL